MSPARPPVQSIFSFIIILSLFGAVFLINSDGAGLFPPDINNLTITSISHYIKPDTIIGDRYHDTRLTKFVKVD